MQAGEAIESKMLSRQIERAQRKVEAHNFDIRKQLLEFDDVANDQRHVIYRRRADLMEAEDIAEEIRAIRKDVVAGVMGEYIPPESVEEMWDKEGLAQAIEREFGVQVDVTSLLEGDHALDEAGLRDEVASRLEAAYEDKVAEVGPQPMRELEKAIMLRQLDMHWKEHIGALDYLRQWIHLRAYAQRKPAQEYKREAFEMFSGMLDRMDHDTIAILSKVQIRRQEDVGALEPRARDTSNMRFQHAAASALAPPPPAPAGRPPPPARPAPVTPYIREQPKVGRNQPCPCGSGKKYKHCHGRLN